jgi:hypothetical protein
MIVDVKFDKWNTFEVVSDDKSIHEFPLTKEVSYVDRYFDKKLRRMANTTVTYTDKYFINETPTGYVFNYTQFPIILSHYLKLGYLSVDKYYEYIKELYLPEIKAEDIPQSLGNMTMYDEQMNIIRTLMTKRFGLCHVFTGFGKTEMIAFMCYYYVNVMKWNVLVTAPNATVLREIEHRINDRLGTKIGVNYPNESGVLCINAASVRRQHYNHHNYQDYLSTIKVILSDEVEACLTPTHLQVYDYCKNRECMYGFSATPDCYCGNLDVNNGVTNESFRNKQLLNTFGGSLINLVPNGFEVNINIINLPWWRVNDRNLIKMSNKFLNSSDIGELPPDYRVRLDNDLFMRSNIAKVLFKLSQTYPNLMVTINRTEVIDYWVKELPEVKILEISGRGYISRYQGKSTQMNVDKLKETYLEHQLIFGTKSLFRGVDLPELHNSIQLSGTKSGQTIQSVGRTARKRLMNVLILSPGEFILGFTNQNKARIELIKSQYPESLNKISTNNITLDLNSL